MAKMKELAMEICELYDMDGLTIMEIVNKLNVSEALVMEALENFSETFGIV
jgi:DNA-binding transcriptional regulator LsrR (DeoR family)